MSIVLNDPEDIVATVIQDAELVVCNACKKDWLEKHAHLIPFATFIPLKAKVTGIHEKCDVCFGNFLDTEF